MEIKKLNTDEMKRIYDTHVVQDFPPDEITSYRIIKRLMKNGLYLCFGFFENGRLQAYALVLKDKRSDALLLDYFAVCPEVRGQGYGSLALKLLMKECDEHSILLLEVEDPAYAANEAEAQIRSRRVSFYHRAGLEDANFTCRLFGVEFLIMKAIPGTNPPPDDLAKVYRSLYITKLGTFLTAVKLKIHLS